MRRAVFILSNDVHARMFAPVADQLRTLGWRVDGIPLDRWYGQGAGPVATALGMPSTMVGPLHGGHGRTFYGRPAPLIVLDALRARRPVRGVLTRLRPDVLIVGNDRGLIEKLALREGRRLGAGTVLLQDGTIGRRSAADRGMRRRLWRAARRTLSGLAGRAGLRDLVATEYGLWGCDLVCVAGPEAARTFVDRGVPSARIVETGQPRYDGLSSAPEPTASGVVWFTTPYGAQNLGHDRQREQIAAVADAALACRGAAIDFVVRPHPRDDAREYHRAVEAGAGTCIGGDVAAVLASAEAAVMSISSVVDEAALIGVPVMVAQPADGALEPLLPPARAYPRVHSGAGVVALAGRWRSDRALRDDVVGRQRAWVAKRLCWDPNVPAANRVAALIDGLPGAEAS